MHLSAHCDDVVVSQYPRHPLVSILFSVTQLCSSGEVLSERLSTFLVNGGQVDVWLLAVLNLS